MGGGVGMISTPAQLLQTSLLLYRITCSFTGLQSNMVLGGDDNPLNCCRPACSFTGLQNNMVLGGVGGGGGHDKHTRSAAADQPALLPDYKITWFWGGGGLGGVHGSTPAQLLAALLPDYKITWFWGGEVGGGHGKHTRSTAADQPALVPDYKITWLWGGGGHDKHTR